MYLQIDNPEQYKAALYIRISKEDGGGMQSQSVANQRSMLMQFAQSRKLFIHGEYVDDGWSGGNFDRPAFRRLIEDIECNRVNMVITKDAYIKQRLKLNKD